MVFRIGGAQLERLEHSLQRSDPFGSRWSAVGVLRPNFKGSTEEFAHLIRKDAVSDRTGARAQSTVRAADPGPLRRQPYFRRFLFVFIVPNPSKWMLGLKQQLVKVDRKRKAIARLLSDCRLPVNPDQFRRCEVCPADGAKKVLTGGLIFELHRVAVDQSYSGILVDKNVALVEVADNHARMMKDFDISRQISSSLHKPSPVVEPGRPISGPAVLVSRCNVRNFVHLDRLIPIDAGHQEPNKSVAIETGFGWPGDSYMLAGRLLPPLGRVANHRANACRQVSTLFQLRLVVGLQYVFWPVDNCEHVALSTFP